MEKYRYGDAELSLIERSCVPIAVYQFIDRRVVTVAVSDGYCRLCDLSREETYELMDNDMYRDTFPDDVSRIADEALRFATEGGKYNTIYRQKIDGEYHIFHAYGEHVMRDGVRLAVIWYNDEGVYSEEKSGTVLQTAFSDKLKDERDKTSETNMFYDSLTGLPGMTYFFSLSEAGISRMILEGRRPVVLFTDMGGMKFFNIRNGFSEGDKLIASVAKVLTSHFSNENCSHFGRDNFAVFTDEDGLVEKLEQIFRECSELNNGNSLPMRVGIYSFRDGMVSATTACDRAKYACDAFRGDFVSSYHYFDSVMLKKMEDQQYIIDNFEKALDERWIKVYFQPIVRTANGRVCDEEALSRWIDPVKGFISPGEFIPILEKTKLIYKLDLYVLDQILLKMNHQKEAGLYLVPQSLNLSRVDFDKHGIVTEICRRVDLAGIPREKLTIEITESAVGSDPDYIKAQIEQLRSLGFRVWMDDFGSGYSSLDVLQNIKFDLIKFDMSFMQKFDRGDESKIILTELIKMAIALGIDTVAEGVETEEQVAFLKEVGCTKLQGYYYCKAIPMEEIVERYRTGRQIGFENPDEAGYFNAVGRINLYDLDSLSSGDELGNFFDTLPMAVIEASEYAMRIVRCNKSYRDFIKRSFGEVRMASDLELSGFDEGRGSQLVSAIRSCGKTGDQTFFEEELDNGTTVHSTVRNIATNPVTGICAYAVAVLGVVDTSERGLTYTQVAQALSADYINLYYVDTETERFTEYSSARSQDLVMGKHGKHFFDTARKDALRYVYEPDRESLLSAFTKENVISAIDKNGAFTFTYRLFMNGVPTYANMKAVRMNNDNKYIIIGVNNVDTQMKQQQALERAREEKVTYSRISALAGNYICIFTVDPVTDNYTEYSAKPEYESLGLPRGGDDFFGRTKQYCIGTVYPDDLQKFQNSFSKEKIMASIKEKGLYVLEYRLVTKSGVLRVNLRGALVEEKDGPQLIIGINHLDTE